MSAAQQQQQRDETVDMPDLPVEDSETPLLDEMMTRVPYTETFQTAQPIGVKRKLLDVERRLLEEARLAGDAFFYGWGEGKNHVEGATVKLANAMARIWGNCVVKPGPLQEMEDSWVFTAYFIDLETGSTMGRQFRQSKKWQVHGRHDEERKDDIRFQIGQSKANRNVILNALPEFLTERAMRAAKEGVTQKVAQWVKEKGLAKAVDIFLATFAKLGVDEPRVLERLGVADKKAIGIEQLAKLSGDKNAIEGGQVRTEEIFPLPSAKVEDLGERIKSGKKRKSDDKPQPAKPAEGECDEFGNPLPDPDMKSWAEGGDPDADPAR